RAGSLALEWRGCPACALDLAFALIAASGKHHGAAAQALLYALATVGTLPLLVRGLFPVPVLAVVVAATTIVGLGYLRGWWPFAAIVALYTVARPLPAADVAQGRSGSAGRARRADCLPGRLEPSGLERSGVGGRAVCTAGGGVAARRQRAQQARVPAGRRGAGRAAGA